MNETLTPPKTSRLDALRQSLAQGSMRHAHRLVNALQPAEIAALLESLPATKREIVWGFIDPEIEGDVLVELNDQLRGDRIDGMDAEELVTLAEGMEVDDLADLYLLTAPDFGWVDDGTRYFPDQAQRDRFFALLRSAAYDRGLTLLIASEEMAALQGVGVLMSISDGELCSTEERGTLVRLPGRRRAEGGR